RSLPKTSKGNKESADLEELEKYKAIVRKATILRDSAIRCNKCQLPSTKPYTLRGCGHSYCLSCIRTAFNACLEEQLEGRRAPVKLHAPFTSHKLKELLRLKYIFVPLYFCPTCGDCQTEKPKKNAGLIELINALTDILGAPLVTAEHRVQPQPEGKNIWAGVYVDEEDSDEEGDSDSEAAQ
ncbi:hypothetical protein BV22DRAFT_1135814, partial [Leucogyrophana mollusca]